MADKFVTLELLARLDKVTLEDPFLGLSVRLHFRQKRQKVDVELENSVDGDENDGDRLIMKSGTPQARPLHIKM